MSLTDKISGKEIGIGIGILIVVAIGMYVTLGFFKAEGAKAGAVISDKGAKNPNHVGASITLLSFDAVKGDASARIAFEPKGNLVSEEDNTLKKSIKFFINSANGKQEIDFAKGKRMPPVEAVINTYDGNVSDYPFDHHKAEVELYLTPGKEEPKKAGEKPPASNPSAEESASAKKEEDEPEDIPLVVDFYGSLPGYKITTEVSKETDENYALFDLSFERSSTGIFFSIFIGVMMWALSIGVLFLVLSVVVRKRKPEIAMCSLMAALLFAFYAVRNSQPNVPPIGVFSDFISFFWAEIIVAACLLIGTFTWILRPNK